MELGRFERPLGRPGRAAEPGSTLPCYDLAQSLVKPAFHHRSPRIGAASATIAMPEPDNPVRTVKCVKLQRELPGLDEPPWPGELGRRIYEQVSADAWKLWEERMTMILNEYRLMPWQKEAQDLVAKYMEEFFFGEESAPPPDYVPQQQK